MKSIRTLAAAILPLMATQTALAQGSAISGQVDIGTRYYFDDGLYAGQSSSGAYAFLGFTIEGGAPLGAGEVVFSFSGLIEEANGRSYGNIARLYYRQVFDGWDLIAGVNTENWAVVESASVMNVINPRDNADPISGAGLLGTPMINLNFYTDAGTFSAYALTGFVEPNETGPENRFRSPIIASSSNPVFEEGSDRHLDLALRYSNNFRVGAGSLDVAATYFDGTSRSPTCTTGVAATSCLDAIVAALGTPPGSPPPGSSADDFFAWLAANATDDLVAAASATPVPGLRNLYQKQRQVGLSAVYAYNDLQLKFEGSWRRAGGSTFFAGVAGGDYTWNDLFGTPHSLTMAVEYLYDDRSSAQGTPLFEDDIFVGLSYRLNNQLDTSFRLSMTHDFSSSAKYYTAGVYSRINDRLGLEVKATHIDTNGYNDPLAFIGKDSFVELTLSTFF